MIGPRMWLWGSIVLVFAGSHLLKQGRTGLVSVDAPALRTFGGDRGSRPLVERRIVSMAPSATETLFVLGLGDRVVGVTRYCNYPPEAARKARIGGLFDPNLEAIVALQPDLIVMLEGSRQNLPAFDKLGLATLVVDHKSVEGILASIRDIGRACGVATKAEAIVADIEARIDRVQAKVASCRRPRVLVSVDRTVGTGRIEDVYAAGTDGHINRLIALAGARNAYPGSVAFPVISSEGILQMNPEVIIDMVPRRAPGVGRRKVADDWRQLAQVDAVKHGRVYVLDEDYITVPGPRFILVVEKLAQLIHPEANRR